MVESPEPCAEFASTLSPFVDRELDVEQSAVLARHLDSCRACSGRVAEYREQTTLIRTLRDVAVPALRPIEPRRAARGRVWLLRSAAALVGVAAYVGFALLTTGRPSPGIVMDDPRLQPLEGHLRQSLPYLRGRQVPGTHTLAFDSSGGGDRVHRYRSRDD